MGTAMERPQRKSTRLPRYDYTQPGAYFVTIVTESRTLLFAEQVAKNVAEQVWQAIPGHFPTVCLDEYIVMPNHLHGIVSIIGDVGARSPRPPTSRQRHVAGAVTAPLQRPTLGRVVAYFKYESTKQINALRQTPGAPIWQRNYYEHVVRNEDELDRIREYIRNNPAQWALDRENPAKNTQRRS